jgi:hypothetical protein
MKPCFFLLIQIVSYLSVVVVVVVVVAAAAAIKALLFAFVSAL